MKTCWHSLIVTAVVFLLIVSGTYLYHNVEGWNYLDSVYFIIITATTIGYGDIAPQTDLGKIITIFYPLVGIGVFLYLVSLISRSVFEKKVKTRITNIKQKEGMYKKKGLRKRNKKK